MNARILICAACLVSVWSASAELPAIEWVTTTWGTGRIRVKFEGDPFEMRFPSEQTTAMKRLGSTPVPVRSGGSYPIPNYVLNVHEAARSTRKRWAGEGYPIDGTLPSIFYVDWHLLNPGAPGVYSRHPLEVYNLFLSPTLYVSADLSPTEAVTTTIHEWGHAVQASYFGTDEGWYGYWAGYLEGTAEWSTDAPFSIKARGVGQSRKRRNISNAASYEATSLEVVEPPPNSGEVEISVDDLNQVHAVHCFGFISGLEGNILLEHDGYGSYPFWKFFAQRSRGSEDSLEAIMKFGESAKNLWVLDHRATIEQLAKHLPDAGSDDLDNFRVFFEDFLAAATRLGSKGGGADRFADDAFQTMSAPDAASAELDFKGWLSQIPGVIPATEAADDREIQDRLASIAKSTGPIRALGWKKARLELGADSFDTGKGSIAFNAQPFKRSRLYLLVLGNGHNVRTSELALAALTANGPRGEISPQVKMERVKLSLQSSDGVSVRHRYSAYTTLSTFNTQGDMERLYLAVGNVDPDGQPHEAAIGYVVVPAFQEYLPGTWNPPAGTDAGQQKVWLVSSNPVREIDKESYRGGDELTFEVGTSERLHVGADQQITPANTTLRVTLLDPVGGEVPLEDVRVNSGFVTATGARLPQRTYRVGFRLPKKLPQEGTYRVRFALSSLLRLGSDDKDTVETTILAGGAAPQVSSVRVEGSASEVFYDSVLGRFQPIPPGKHTLKIMFDQKLVEDKTVIDLSGRKLEGKLSSGDKVWSTELDVPEDPQGFDSWEGLNTLKIAVTSAKDVPLDADPSLEGPQPDTAHRLLFDLPAPWLKRVSASVDGQSVYEAEWQQAAAEAERTDWRAKTGTPLRRELKHQTRRRIPQTAKRVAVTFELSKAVEAKPSVKIAGQTLEVTQDGDNGAHWRGEFDATKVLLEAGREKPVQFEIEASDRYGNGLDADPTTVPAIVLPGDPSGVGANLAGYWVDYEAQFAGGSGAGKGGPDLWHQLNVENDPQWYQETQERAGTNFTLFQRGDQMIARFGRLDYRGMRRSGGRWEIRADPTLEYTLSTAWHDPKTRRRISTPAKAVKQAFARGSGDLYYLKLPVEISDPASEWKFEGEDHTYQIYWDDKDELTRIQPPALWTRIRWKPVAAPANEPALGKNVEPEQKEALPVIEETRYRIVEKNAAGLKIVVLERLAFRQQGKAGARFVVTAYPVSYLERPSGQLTYMVQWRSGESTLTRLTVDSDQIAAIRQEFEDRSVDGFSNSEIDARLQRIFGSESRPLDARNSSGR